MLAGKHGIQRRQHVALDACHEFNAYVTRTTSLAKSTVRQMTLPHGQSLLPDAL